jgi:hypothetical protein
MISKTISNGFLAILFGVMGAIELWLWKIGHTNEYGLYFGMALIVGALLSALQFIKHNKRA